VIAAAQYASEEWRKDKGLDKWMDGAVPGWLQGSIPTGENGKLRVSGFTPFGLAGDPLTTAGSAVLPQFSGILMASKGMDWTGRSLEPYGEADDGQKAAAAASAMASAFIPGLSLGLRLEKDGPAALNPLKPVKPPEKKKKLKKSTAKSGAAIVRSSSTPSADDWSEFSQESSGSSSSSGGSDWSEFAD
jgi:hypothetical protein